MTILMLLMCSSMAMAEGDTTRVDLPIESVQKTTEVNEVVGSYFIWSIPSSVTLTNGTGSFTVEVSEAHLEMDKYLDITIGGITNSKLQLSGVNGAGSEVILKDGETVLNGGHGIISLSSSVYGTAVANNTKTITLEARRHLFQYTGTYTNTLTFTVAVS